MAHVRGPHYADVNDDGLTDLVGHFRTLETEIALGDTEACLTGELLDGTAIESCDEIKTVEGEGGWGIGFELAFVLPGLLWLRGRRSCVRSSSRAIGATTDNSVL